MYKIYDIKLTFLVLILPDKCADLYNSNFQNPIFLEYSHIHLYSNIILTTRLKMAEIQLQGQKNLNKGAFKKKQLVNLQIDMNDYHNNINQKKQRKLIQKSDTIEVLSDDQEKSIIKSIFEEELFRTKIEQAKLTKSKFIILKTLYIQLYFSNIRKQDKNKKFNSMLKGFISKHLKTSKNQPFDMRTSHFFDKMIAKPNQQFVQNQYIVYGCDLISHKQIQKIFTKQKPTIKWIDASHCRLSFMNKISGWQAVLQNCLKLQQLEKDLVNSTKVEDLLGNLDIQQQQQKQIVESKYNQKYLKLQGFKKSYHLLRDYVQLMPYYEIDFKRRLMIRNATFKQQLIEYNIQVNKQTQKSKSINQQSLIITSSNNNNDNSQLLEIINNKNLKGKLDSEYKRYLLLKQQFMNGLQNNKLVKPKYQQIKQQIQKQTQMIRLKGKYGKKYNKNQNTLLFNHIQNHNYKNHIDNTYSQSYRKDYNNSNHNYNHKNNYNNYNHNNHNHNNHNHNNHNQQYYNQDYSYHKNNHKKKSYQAAYNNRNRSRESNIRLNNNENCQQYQKKRHLKIKQRKQHNIQKDFDYYIQQRDGITYANNNNQNNLNNSYSNFRSHKYQYNQQQIQEYYKQYKEQYENIQVKNNITIFNNNSNKISNNNGSDSLSNYEYNPKQIKHKHKQNQMNFQQYIERKYQQKLNSQKIGNNIIQQNNSSFLNIQNQSFRLDGGNKSNLNLQQILNNINYDQHQMSYISPSIQKNNHNNIREFQDDDLDFIITQNNQQIRKNQYQQINQNNSNNNNKNINININNNKNYNNNNLIASNFTTGIPQCEANNTSKIQAKIQVIQPENISNFDFISHLKMQSQQIHQYEIQRKNSLINQSQMINNQKIKSTERNQSKSNGKRLIPKKKKNYNANLLKTNNEQ